MRLAEYLQTERGLCARVAKRLGIAPAYLSQIASGARTAPPALAREIEAECAAGAVRRQDLRPDDWHRIWPELVRTDGATEGHPAPLAPAAAPVPAPAPVRLMTTAEAARRVNDAHVNAGSGLPQEARDAA